MSTADMAEAIASFRQTIDELIDEVEKRSDVTTAAGEGDAAEVELGKLRRGVDVDLDTNGSCTMTVEVSNDGYTWAQMDTQDLNDDQEIFQYDVPWEHIRAWADQNLDRIEISAGGFQ